MKIKYLVKDTWPYSIDSKIKGGKVEEMEIDETKVFLKKNGDRYYRLTVGHGHFVDLLVTDSIKMNTEAKPDGEKKGLFLKYCKSCKIPFLVEDVFCSKCGQVLSMSEVDSKKHPWIELVEYDPDIAKITNEHFKELL